VEAPGQLASLPPPNPLNPALSVTDRDHDGGGVRETDDEWRRVRLLVELGLLVARKHDEHDQEARQELDAERLALRDTASEHRAPAEPHVPARHVPLT